MSEEHLRQFQQIISEAFDRNHLTPDEYVGYAAGFADGVSWAFRRAASVYRIKVPDAELFETEATKDL